MRLSFRNKSLKLYLFAILSALVFTTTGMAAGDTIYVAKWGSNRNSCESARSWDTPKLTIAAGIRCIDDGDILIIGDGLYREQLNNTIPSGFSHSPTIIQAANPNGVRMRPSGTQPGYVAVFTISERSYITIDGIDADAANVEQPYYILDNSHNITLQNGTARNGKGTYGSGIELKGVSNNYVFNMDVLDNGENKFAHGIYVSGANNVIDGNRFYRNSGYGIHVYGGWHVSYNIIRNNEVFENVWGSAIVWGGEGNLFYDNLIYENGPLGIGSYYDNVGAASFYYNP